jgi:SAM-dependent methyltransferase
LSTDNDWDKWGEIDPYFGVLSSDEYHADNLSDESRANFFQSGEKHIGRVLANARRHLDADFQPARSLDFGCGVGRLVIPLAGLSEKVVGVDVSDHMIREATSNCQKKQIENVSFVKSDDGLTQLGGSFNLIHSCLVLQHIPTNRGMQFIEALLGHLEPGGVVVIQFYYACKAPKLIRSLVKLRYKLPIANAARNLLRGRPLSEPAMQLHTYDFGSIIDMFKAVGVDSFYFQPGNHGEFQNVTLYAQKSNTNDAGNRLVGEKSK